MDMHTAQHLVAQCLSGPLAQGRTIILVTHHFSLCLPAASYVVELSHGGVLRQGYIHDFSDLGQLNEIVVVENDVPEDAPLNEGPENEADTMQSEQHPANGSRNMKGKLVDIEARAEGRVSWLTYLTYIRAAGIASWILTIMLLLLLRAINIGNQVIIYTL